MTGGAKKTTTARKSTASSKDGVVDPVSVEQAGEAKPVVKPARTSTAAAGDELTTIEKRVAILHALGWPPVVIAAQLRRELGDRTLGASRIVVILTDLRIKLSTSSNGVALYAVRTLLDEGTLAEWREAAVVRRDGLIASGMLTPTRALVAAVAADPELLGKNHAVLAREVKKRGGPQMSGDQFARHLLDLVTVLGGKYRSEEKLVVVMYLAPPTDLLPNPGHESEAL